MENEAVSKNFIEQIIEKDLAEGHCETVKTRCKVHSFKFRVSKKVRRRIQSPF